MRTVAKVLGWIGVVLLMLAGGLAGGIYLYAHETVKELAPHSRAVIVAQQKLSVPLPGQPAIALVLGYDKRFAGVDRFGNSRSDTVMLLRADPKTKTVSMLSFRATCSSTSTVPVTRCTATGSTPRSPSAARRAR